MIQPTSAIALFLGLASFWDVPAASAAAKCGDPWREPCLSESDPRYDSDANYNLKDQHDIWTKHGGYSEEEIFRYHDSGEPMLNQTIDIPGIGPMLFSSFPFKSFTNVTVLDSRVIMHRYFIFPPYNDGLFGVATGLDAFSTSTFELDGSMVTLPLQSSVEDVSKVDPDFSSRTHVVGNDTFFGKIVSGTDSARFVTQALTCLDSKCDLKRSMVSIMDGVILESFQLEKWSRKSEEEWMAAIKDDYAVYRVPAQAQSPVPMTNTSLSGQYPTESQWCEYDPYCAEDKPYEEVTTPVKPGIIAGFTILGIALLLAVLFVAFRIHSKAQAKRYRAIFAARVAQTMSVKVSAKRMDAEALAREFQKIDSKATSGNAGANGHRSSKSGAGQISKADMWEFLSSGKACEIRESDFEALWAVMDSDGNGSVDFLEFCAFMGQCHEEYDNARDNRALMAERLSRQFSMRVVPPADTENVKTKKIPDDSNAAAAGEDESDVGDYAHN